MNTAFLESFSTHPLVVSVGWTLVHFVWQATLVGVVVAVVLGMLRRSAASARYFVACAGLMLMTAAPVGTFAWLVSGTDAEAWKAINLVATSELPTDVPAFSNSPGDLEVERSSDLEFDKPFAHAPAIAPGTGNAVQDHTAVSPLGWSAWLESFSGKMQRWLPWCVVIWIVGVMCLSARLLVGLRRVWMWKSEGVEIVGGELAAAVSRLSARMNLRQRVRLLKTARETVPAVIGWIRPAILVPASMLSGLTTNELESILAHELAHIRRYDYLVNLLQTVVETLLFYHPAVWWLSNRIRAERENCCDDVAIAVCGNRVMFAQALARMEEIRCRGERLSIAANGGSLVNRIRRIVGHESTSIGLPWPAGVMVFGSIGLLICGSWILSVANAEPSSPLVQEPEPLMLKSSMNADSNGEDVEEFETRKSEVSETDSKTGSVQRIFFGISLETRNGQESRTATLGMKYSNLMRYSFIPARVAKELGAVEWGEIDFGEKPPTPNVPPQVLFIDNPDGLPVVEPTPQTAPAGKTIHVHELTGPVDGDTTIVPLPDDAIWIPDHLAFYGMNQTQQHVFKIVRIEKVDLGVGPAFGPVTALVLDDANSDFGVLGSDWTQQVRGENGEGLWFEAATGSFVFMANPEHLKEAEAPAKAAMEPGQSDQEPGRMIVTSSGHADTPARQDRVGVKVLASHTYPDGSRQSTGWVEMDGSLVPVDEGVEHVGIKVYESLMFDIVAVDLRDGKTIWNVGWGKSMPIWKTVSIVQLDQPGGEQVLAVELYVADPHTQKPIYQYHALTTGEKIEPPAVSAANENDAVEQGQGKKSELKFRTVGKDNERITRVAIEAFGHGRSATELVRHFWAMDHDISKFRDGVSTTNMETIVSAVDINYLFDIATEAPEIIFNLPEGSEMRAEFSGENVEITQGEKSTTVVITKGRLELIDAGGVIRAWASPDGSAKQLVVDCRKDLGEVVMVMKTRCIEPSPDYSDPPVQAVLNTETGAPEDEKEPPHRGIRYEVQGGKDDGKPFVRMKMKWRYDLKRLADEAVAESGLTLEELILGNHDQEPDESSSRRRPDQSNTGFFVAALAGALGDWNDVAASVQFDSRAYMTFAQTLLKMNEAAGIEVLREIGKQRHEGQLIVLCRMLFEAKEGGEFRRPGLGGPVFVTAGKTVKDFPLEPIALIENVPFLIVRGYDLGGQAEPATAYLEYCLKECQWTSQAIENVDEQVEKALKTLDEKKPFWGESLGVLEWNEFAELRSQLQPTFLIEIKSPSDGKNTDCVLNGNMTVKLEDIEKAIQKSGRLGSTNGPASLIVVAQGATKSRVVEMVVGALRELEIGQTRVVVQESIEQIPNTMKADDIDGWGTLAFASGLRSRLTLLTEKPVMGQPILFKLEVRNFGDEPTEIDPQKYAPFRVLRVQNKDFTPAATFIGMTPQTSGQAITLQPGESHLLWENVDASELYLLGEVRDYFIFAEGGEWAMQALWQDSNRVKVNLVPGDLPPRQSVIADLIPKLPQDWKLSTGFGAIYISSSPTNLKKDVTTIQLVFLDEAAAKKLKDTERDPREIVTGLGQTVLGEAFLIAPADASNLWRDYKDQVEASISVIRLPPQQGQSERKQTDASDKDKPWSVSGTVTDVEGKPQAGVTVKAHCGFGTLFQTGSGTTDEQGHYDFRFGPGGRGSPKLVQAATISVSMDGFTERNLHRQGDCIAALEQPDEIGWGDRTEEHLFLPGKPMEINFVMVPAVSLRGKVIVGDSGKPAQDYSVSLTGPDLPPSSSVIAQTKVGEDGSFSISEIPAGFLFQVLVRPAKRGSPWNAWASPPMVFVRGQSDNTHIEYVHDGKPVDFSFQYLYVTVNGEGTNWKTALKDAAETKLKLKWDGLSTDSVFSAGMAFLELGEKKE